MQEHKETYKKLGIPIIVIVGQKRDAVKKWLNQNPLPFPFLIDEKRTVIKAFDVYHSIGIDAFRIAYPSLFLITAQGRVAFAYVGKNQADRPSQALTHAEVLKALKQTFND